MFNINFICCLRNDRVVRRDQDTRWCRRDTEILWESICAQLLWGRNSWERAKTKIKLCCIIDEDVDAMFLYICWLKSSQLHVHQEPIYMYESVAKQLCIRFYRRIPTNNYYFLFSAWRMHSGCWMLLRHWFRCLCHIHRLESPEVPLNSYSIK